MTNSDEQQSMASTQTEGASAGSATPEVERALARLQTLADKALPEHVETFEQVHHLLQDRLAQAEK